MPSQHNAAASLLEFDSSVPYEIFKRNLQLLLTGQVVVDFNIILDKNRVIFYGPPDKSKSKTVRGKVRLEVAGKLHVKEIMLTLAGEFHIINENSDLIPDEPLQGTLFSTCILLANKRTLTPGIHEFFFEFFLPGDLPESMNSDLILCEYFLKAELVPRSPDDLSVSKNKLVDIVDLSVQRTSLQSDEHVRQGLGTTRHTGSVDKVLDYEFLVPRILKLDSDTFKFYARWDGLRVDNVKFWFVQTENFKSLKSTEGGESLPDRKSKTVSGPFCFDLPKKEPLKLQSRPMVFQLPITEPLIRDCDLNNVEIRHKLVISIQMANKNKELIQLSIPIMIESIVEDTGVTPPPCHASQNNQAAVLHFANKIYPGKSLEDNNQQKLSSSPSTISLTASSFKRFIEKVRTDQSSESTTTKESDSIEHTTFQFSRRSSGSGSIIRGRKTSNNNNVSIINTQNSISTIVESASEYTADEYSNDNTIATTATYTNNTEHERNPTGFAQKGLHKTSFSGNVITETFNKFINRGNSKKRISRTSSTVRFAPGLYEVISMHPNTTTNIASGINNGSLTT